jgi:secondary thiamine-phosphate synthase enzyme
MQEFIIQSTKPREIIDITQIVQNLVTENTLNTCVCNLFLLHTTAALTTADLDYGTDQDMLDAFEHIVPKLQYRHPHNPGHVKDHIMSAIIGANINLPVEQGKLVLGAWQRVLFVELGGPRERTVVASFTNVIE